jgi:large-conductance mechanosensitive channel
MNSFSAIPFVLVAFVVTFTVARLLRHAYRKRQSKREAAEEFKGQSRQVRRARGRKGR